MCNMCVCVCTYHDDNSLGGIWWFQFPGGDDCRTQIMIIAVLSDRWKFALPELRYPFPKYPHCLMPFTAVVVHYATPLKSTTITRAKRNHLDVIAAVGSGCCCLCWLYPSAFIYHNCLSPCVTLYYTRFHHSILRMRQCVCGSRTTTRHRRLWRGRSSDVHATLPCEERAALCAR